MSFLLPRYTARVVVSVALLGGGDETETDPFFWFASFVGTSSVTVGWPVTTGAIKTGLSRLGIPQARRR